jgi:hypothetical protein
MGVMGALLSLPWRRQGSWIILVWAMVAWVLRGLIEVSKTYPDYYSLTFGMLLIAWIIAIGVLLQFSWLLLQRVAFGHTTPPRQVDIEEISPFMNLMALKIGALVLAIVGLVDFAYEAGTVAGHLTLVVTASLLPAMIAVMVLEERFLAGCSPRFVGTFLSRFGISYLLFAPLLYGALATVYLAVFTEQMPNVLTLLVAAYAFVVGHVFCGRLLYVNRSNLEILTEVSPEQEAGAEWAETNKRIDDLLMELHQLCGVGHIRRAHVLLDRFLASTNYELDDIVHERLQSFQDVRLTLEHAFHYMGRLLANDRPARAWHLVKRCLDLDDQFRPANDTDTLRMVAAATPADASYIDLLLSDFERAYPASELLPDALFAWGRCCIEHLGRVDKGLVLLARVKIEFPEFADAAEFRVYYAAVRLRGA